MDPRGRSGRPARARPGASRPASARRGTAFRGPISRRGLPRPRGRSLMVRPTGDGSAAGALRRADEPGGPTGAAAPRAHGLGSNQRPGHQLRRALRSLAEVDLRLPQRAHGPAGRAARGGHQRARGVGHRPLRRGVQGEDGGMEGRAGRGQGGPRGDPAGGLRARPRGVAPHPGAATLRRPARRGRRAAPRRDRRDDDGRGQDARRDAAALPERALGATRLPRDGERLPRAPRRELDGPDLRVHGAHLRCDPEQHGLADACRHLRPRHRLRDEQRVRVRLSA